MKLAGMFIVASLCGTAYAQSAEAEQLFQEAVQLMAAGKTAEACTAFEGSNRIEARAGTLIRLGECREKNNQLASAWSAFTDALSRVKDPRKREIAAAAIKALEPRLSKLTINVPDASRVVGLVITRNGKSVDEALWNRAIPIDGGDYELVASAPGRQSTTLKIAIGQSSDNAKVDIPVLVSPTVPQPTAVEPAARPSEERPIVQPATGNAEPSSFTTRRKIGIAVGLVGVGGFALGTVFGLQAKKREDEAFGLCPDPDNCADPDTAQAKLDSASSRALLSNVMFGVGVLGVAGAAVLWFTGAPEASGVALRPNVSSSQIGLAIESPF